MIKQFIIEFIRVIDLYYTLSKIYSKICLLLKCPLQEEAPCIIMIFYTWLFCVLSGLSIISASGFKRDVNSLYYDDKNGVPKVNQKRSKSDDSAIADLEFQSYVTEFGSHDELRILLHYVHLDMVEALQKRLKILLKNDYHSSLHFDLYLQVLKYAMKSNKNLILGNLITFEFLPSISRRILFVELVLKKKYPKALRIAFDAGLLINIVAVNGKSLASIIVERDWTDLIDLVYSSAPENSSVAKSLIFLAKSPKMVKLIRSHYKGTRQSLDLHGRFAWQVALLNKRYEFMDAMISLRARLKQFRSKHLDYYKLGWVKSASLLIIHRNNLLRSSYMQVCNNATKWFGPNHKFFIKYVGEIGMDAGGLKQEWMTNLIKIFFKPNPQGSASEFKAPLFVIADENTGVFAPNIDYEPDAFRFAGSIIAIALMMGISVGYKFIPAIYKFIMNFPIDIESDMIRHSPDTWKNLSMLNSPDVDIRELQLSLPSNPLASVTRRLIPRYIKEYAEDILFGRYQSHILAFKSGFEISLPEHVKLFFRLEEFEKILYGEPTEMCHEELFELFIFQNSETEVFMTNFMNEIEANRRKNLFKFITGLETLAPFQVRKGKIHVVIEPGLKGRYPTASTCGPTLKLPPLDDYKKIVEKLEEAIMDENIEGFHYEPGLSPSDRIVLGYDDDDESTNYLEFSDAESEVSDIED